MRDRHNELLVTFEAASGPARTFKLRVRVFDDGFGFRYEVPQQPGYGAVNITEELTEFRLDRQPRRTSRPGGFPAVAGTATSTSTTRRRSMPCTWRTRR